MAEPVPPELPAELPSDEGQGEPGEYLDSPGELEADSDSELELEAPEPGSRVIFTEGEGGATAAEMLQQVANSLNGSTAILAGLACMSGDRYREGQRIPWKVANGNEICMVSTCEAIGEPMADLKRRALVIACASGVITQDMVDPRKGSFSYTGEDLKPIPEAAKWNKSDEDFDAKVWSVVIASKVAFFNTNHHLGGTTGQASGYMAKMISTVLGEEVLSDERAITEIHTMVHWFDTRRILRALVHRHDDIPGFPQVEQDVWLRISGAPAGTAKLFFCDAVLKNLGKTPLLAYLPVTIQDTHDLVYQVNQNPLVYHVGGRHLADNHEDIWIDEDLVANLMAFVKKFHRRSTIAKTKFACGGMPDTNWVAVMDAYADMASTIVEDAELAESLRAAVGFGEVPTVYEAYA